MGKRIYWVLLILISAAGLISMIYFGLQPRPIPKIKISRFENHTVVANSLLLRLREEIKASPLLFLGVEPARPEHLQIVKEFLRLNQEPGSRFDQVVLEEHLASPEFPEATLIATQENFETFRDGTKAALAAGKRVVVIVPTIYASQLIHGNVVQNFKAQTEIIPMSLSLTDFPRKRELEKDMIHLCVVEGVDTSGEGPFGCMIAQTARANYRKHFQPGELVGLVDQVGLKDYLMLLTIEK
jgi:hypothetical protein